MMPSPATMARNAATIFARRARTVASTSIAFILVNLLSPSTLRGPRRRALILERLDITAKSQFRAAYARALPSGALGLISGSLPHPERHALLLWPLPAPSLHLGTQIARGPHR